MSFVFWTFIFIICYLMFLYQIISFWYEKLYPGVMSHLKSESADIINYYLLTEFDGNKRVVNTKRYYLPLENGLALHLYKFEFPSPNNAMCQVWLKMAQWFWRRLSVLVGEFRYFSIIFLLKRTWSFIRTSLYFVRKNGYCRILKKKTKMWKVHEYNNAYDENDNEHMSLVRKAHLSLRLR